MVGSANFISEKIEFLKTPDHPFGLLLMLYPSGCFLSYFHLSSFICFLWGNICSKLYSFVKFMILFCWPCLLSITLQSRHVFSSNTSIGSNVLTLQVDQNSNVVRDEQKNLQNITQRLQFMKTFSDLFLWFLSRSTDFSLSLYLLTVVSLHLICATASCLVDVWKYLRLHYSF